MDGWLVVVVLLLLLLPLLLLLLLLLLLPLLLVVLVVLVVLASGVGVGGGERGCLLVPRMGLPRGLSYGGGGGARTHGIVLLQVEHIQQPQAWDGIACKVNQPTLMSMLLHAALCGFLSLRSDPCRIALLST